MSAEDIPTSSSKSTNGAVNGTNPHTVREPTSTSSSSGSTFTAVNGNSISRPVDSSSTIRVAGPPSSAAAVLSGPSGPPSGPSSTVSQVHSPSQQLLQLQHQSSSGGHHQSHHQHQHQHHHSNSINSNNANSTHHSLHNLHNHQRSQTASHASQSGSGEEDAGDHSDITGSNLQSPVTPNSHPDPKYIQAASDRPLSVRPSGSPESNHQKRKRSNSIEGAMRVEAHGQIRDMSSDIVHPQYHGHSMPMTKDTRMTDASADSLRDEMMTDRHASEHIAQRASEEAAKLEDMRARDPANFEAHVTQLQGTPQGDHIRTFNANMSPGLTPINGTNQTPPGQPETKRKRIFSNRTKTGCITCRRRKKKCDEGKPHCNNCNRGGFKCGGYAAPINASFATMTTPVMRTDRSAPLPPLDYTRPQPNQVVVQHTALPGEGKPFGATGLPLSGPAPPPVQPIRRDSQVAPHLQGPEPPKPPPQASPFSGPRVPPQPPLPQRFSSTEKERMLNGELFHAFTPELIEERERCRAACWRFNNAANPTLCISREEKLRLQMEIFRPTAGTRGPQGTAWHGDLANSHLRKNLGLQDPVYPVNEEPWIEVPFMCDYGYNITLGPGVFINFGCTIIDTCAVTIKARTLIGPNVNIYSGTHPLNPRTRNGTKGPEFGKPVIIEEDCWIAGNVTILPGVKIGVGATVGAGAVVTRDVPPHTVVAGNPAKVIKGIMEHE
ncbi:Maltose acetyltransferase [Orbilia ellipsospora]|uniref:Maltose acetyltransferase n=1 Tax=Orbilia ellipsospora TaxID=2528407 RepID=A0AAV9X3P3_9PEZI